MSLESYKAAKKRLERLQAAASGAIDIHATPVGAGLIQVVAEGADADQTLAIADAIGLMDAAIFNQAIAAAQVAVDQARPSALAELQVMIADVEGA